MAGSHLDDEELESVPWDALLDDGRGGQRRWVTVGALGVAAVVLLVTVARTLWPSSPAPVALPPSTAPEAAAAAPVEEEPAEPASPGKPEEPRVMSEADLMALDGDDASLAAASHAAWFASAYFTLDGGDRSSLAARLPAGVSLPPADPAARSFVESAEPVSVSRLGPARFEVVVVLRTLSATGGAAYVRDPDRAVAVVVELGPEGGSVVDLPTPVPLPAAPSPALTLDPAEAPPAVREAAVAAGSSWGTARIESTARLGDAWRVLLTVTSESGVSWPLVVLLDDSGAPLLASLRLE